MEKVTLAQALKQAKEAEKAEAQAQAAREKAEELVARVRSQESKEKIEKALADVLEYAQAISEFDPELQKSVKSKLREIVKAAFGKKWKIIRQKAKPDVDTIPFHNEMVVEYLKEVGATSKEKAIPRKDIESGVQFKFGLIGDAAFDSNAWSKRDTKMIKSIGEAKQKCYYTTE